jgi:Fe-S cluster assembly protein SufD
MSALAARRKEALAVFTGHGLPTRRVEEWKYSDLKVALGEAGLGQAVAQVVAGVPDGVEQIDLAAPNLPAWVEQHLGTLAKNAVAAASLTYGKGIALRVPRNSAIAAPLTLAFQGAGHARILIVLEEGASLTLSETGDTAGPRNSGLEIVLGANAHLEHVRLAAATAAVQVAEVGVSLARNARYQAHLANFGARLSRTELTIALDGEGAEAHLSGVSVLGGKSHADVTTHVIHRHGHTNSSQLFKKVAGGDATAVYQGKVTVAKGADKADSRQTAKALLLGPRAEADLKPELEIFADDVKCAHGAAVGDLDAESLFYLRARGIPEAQARSLLVHAFLEDALADITRDDLRNQVRAAVNAALEAA